MRATRIEATWQSPTRLNRLFNLGLARNNMATRCASVAQRLGYSFYLECYVFAIGQLRLDSAGLSPCASGRFPTKPGIPLLQFGSVMRLVNGWYAEI